MHALRRRYGRASTLTKGGPLSIGDKVRVNLGRRGGVQEGTVTALLPEGRFRWKNRANFERTAKLSQLTTAREHAGMLDPYVAAWAAEDDGDD